MKAVLCVFSGTGNTLRVGERLALELNSYGIETSIFRICANKAMPDIRGSDLLIVGYPVHAFNAPTIVLEFIKNLPDGCGKRAYIMRTSGEPLTLNDASGIKPRRLLSKRGYKVMGEFSYVMPYNIIFRHSDKMAARMWLCAEKRLANDAAAIAKGEGKNKKVNPFKRAVSFTLRIEHAAMPYIGKRFKVNNDLCIKCAKCVTLCPLSNINLVDGEIKFGKSCVGCMACSFGCPKDAIKISVLNGWRVNGSYAFDEIAATDEEVCKYCRKSYLKYFHESEMQNEAVKKP